MICEANDGLPQGGRFSFGAPWRADLLAFAAAFALLTAGFYLLPDQAGRNLLLYLTAVVAHAQLRRRGPWRAAFTGPLGWAVPALVLAPALSLAWSSGAGQDLVKDLLIAGYCILAVYLGVAATLPGRERLADALVVLMLAAGNLAAGVAIARWLAEAHTAGSYRLEGAWGIDNPVHASVLLLGATLPMLVAVMAGLWRRRWLASAVVPLVFVLLAGARMAAAAYLLVVAGLMVRRRPRALLWAGAAALVGCLALVIAVGADVLIEVWLARGLSYRDEVWQQVWSAYQACPPLIGCGIGTPLTVQFAGVTGERAHSVLLAALYHQGILGLAVLLLALGALLWSGLRSTRTWRQGWAWMLAFTVLANLTSGDHVLVRAALFWPSFWIPVMILAATGGRESFPASRP